MNAVHDTEVTGKLITYFKIQSSEQKVNIIKLRAILDGEKPCHTQMMIDDVYEPEGKLSALKCWFLDMICIKCKL